MIAMVSDRAIWRVAQLLIRKHGSDADLVVAKGDHLMLARSVADLFRVAQ